MIDKLRLDKGFDDDGIDLGNFNPLKKISFATILIGGLLIVDYFPSFISNSYLAFKSAVQTKDGHDYVGDFSESTNYFDWAIAAMNLVIGFLLLTNYRNISNWVTKANTQNNG